MAARGEERTEVRKTYLEMRSVEDLLPARSSEPGLSVERVFDCPAAFYRFLYREVGRAYRWEDRASWTDDEIRAHLRKPEISLHLLSCRGAPAGYFELARCPDGTTEIAYFGLLPEFLRRGLGKHLLTVATEEAFATGATRIWLHTCSLDDPAALPNYQRRGFSAFRSETYWV